MGGTFPATSFRMSTTEFSETPSGVPRRSAPRARATVPATPATPPPHRPAAGRGRPRAAKRRGRWLSASVRSSAAGTRAGRDSRGAGARRAERRAHTPTRTAGTRRRRLSTPDSGPAPSLPRPARRASPGPDGARGQGAPARSAPAALGGAAAPGSAAARRLLCGGSRYAQPGLGCPALRASSPLLCPPPCTPTPVCRSGDRRPALCWLRVVSLTCASSSLASQGAEGRLRARRLGARSPARWRRERDTVCARGAQCSRFQLGRRTPGRRET